MVKTGPRSWELRSSFHKPGDGAIGYYGTRKAAEADKVSGFYVNMYEKDGRFSPFPGHAGHAFTTQEGTQTCNAHNRTEGSSSWA